MAEEWVRYILADEVGLGKTIEAGLIIKDTEAGKQMVQIPVDFVVDRQVVQQAENQHRPIFKQRGTELRLRDQPRSFQRMRRDRPHQAGRRDAGKGCRRLRDDAHDKIEDPFRQIRSACAREDRRQQPFPQTQDRQRDLQKEHVRAEFAPARARLFDDHGDDHVVDDVPHAGDRILDRQKIKVDLDNVPKETILVFVNVQTERSVVHNVRHRLFGAHISPVLVDILQRFFTGDLLVHRFIRHGSSSFLRPKSLRQPAAGYSLL